MSNAKYNNVKVEEALDLLQVLPLTEADFLDLAIACLDQGGLSARGQAVVRQAIGMDPLRDLGGDTDDLALAEKTEKPGKWS
jgi:hypothetical protein